MRKESAAQGNSTPVGHTLSPLLPLGTVIVVIAALVYLAAIPSPPSLMDDMDAVQAQIARNMLESGDWVTPRINGVRYLEKPPLKYWLIALSYAVFGIRDWVARLPVATSAVCLCWLVYRIGRWGICEPVGFYAGLVLACSVGLWLFTRVQFSDPILALTITLAIWSYFRCLEPTEDQHGRWSAVGAAAVGTGLLVKGLVALVFPVGTLLFYLALTHRLLDRETWQRLHPWKTVAIILGVAAPWHVVATLQNPPYFDFASSCEPFRWRGFFWFYFLNEHVFRFLGTRYPRDYNWVPLGLFWLLHAVWFFPWTAFVGGLRRLAIRPLDRASRLRLLAVCWIGVVIGFFSFSSRQEYYTLPCYPAIALLLGEAFARAGRAVDWGRKILFAVFLALTAALVGILIAVRDLPGTGDISRALSPNPELYTLSLGHMADLTLAAFAYLKLPVTLAAVATVVGALVAWRLTGYRLALGLALAMILFFQAARQALIVFDPVLSSRELAQALQSAPPGGLIVDDQYYRFSSVFFYANRSGLLLNGRKTNLEYGSLAPDAPPVFISDGDLPRLWLSSQRWYLVAEEAQLRRVERLVGRQRLFLVKASGGKGLWTNQPLPGSLRAGRREG